MVVVVLLTVPGVTTAPCIVVVSGIAVVVPTKKVLGSTFVAGRTCVSPKNVFASVVVVVPVTKELISVVVVGRI